MDGLLSVCQSSNELTLMMLGIIFLRVAKLTSGPGHRGCDRSGWRVSLVASGGQLNGLQSEASCLCKAASSLTMIS